MKEQLTSIAEQLVTQVTNTMTMLLNSELSISGLEISDSQILSDAIDLSVPKVITEIQFQDAKLGKLAVILSQENAIQIACMMMGSKELSEFDSVKQDAYNSALEQSFKEGLKQLELDSNIFNFKTFTSSVLTDAAKLEDLKTENAQGLSLEIKNSQGAIFSAYVELPGNLVEALLELAQEPEASTSQAQGAQDKEPKTVGDYLGTSFGQIIDTHDPEQVDEKKNLNLIMDIRMGLIVELGRAEMHLKDILKLTKGSIIELDRLSGEPVDLFVNNKLIARGEVVVIDDNFGLRITQLAGVQSNREIELGLVD